MSQLYYNPSHQSAAGVHSTFPTHPTHAAPHHSHHHGARSRRGARFNQSQNSNKSFKNNRAQRESLNAAHAIATRRDFEAARSFELEDDEIFCPFHLLTEDDLHSINSSSSDRSSLSSNSPEQSPLQNQLQPTPSFSLNNAANTQMPMAAFQHGNTSHLKLHQPMAQRTRNAIPIVDPNSRNGSPPNSVSPGHPTTQKLYSGRRW